VFIATVDIDNDADGDDADEADVDAGLQGGHPASRPEGPPPPRPLARALTVPGRALGPTTIATALHAPYKSDFLDKSDFFGLGVSVELGLQLLTFGLEHRIQESRV
jgi:hypothetical protein